MFGKLIEFFVGGGTFLPPYRRQLSVVAEAYLGLDGEARTYSTKFVAPRPARHIEDLSGHPPVESAQAKPDAPQFGLVRREPLFSHQDQRAIGHEIMLNNSSALLGCSVNPMLRRMHDELLLKSILTLDSPQSPGNELVFIQLSPDSLEHELILQLPCRNTVLAFSPERENADRLIARCRELKAHGFSLALDDFCYSAGFYPLLGLVDYVRFDISRKSILELKPQMERIPRLAEKILIAKKVHTAEIQKIAFLLSFRHYQGSRFDHSAPGTEPTISRQQVKIIGLMNALRSRAKSSAIEEELEQENALSHQLLRHINSPANGLMQQLDSISDAVQTLRHDMLYRWLSLLLFFQEKPEHGHITLLENALVRGRLTELFGQQNRSATESIELFVTGMFSQLDLLFELPLAMILNHFDLSAPVKQALLENIGPYAPLLKLAIACEDHDQPSIEHHAAMAGISPEQTRMIYVKAVVWVQEIDL